MTVVPDEMKRMDGRHDEVGIREERGGSGPGTVRTVSQETINFDPINHLVQQKPDTALTLFRKPNNCFIKK